MNRRPIAPWDAVAPLDARIGTTVLFAGALGFGVLGVVAPTRLARMLGSDDAAARVVGVRDVGNALAFLAAPPSAAAAQRMLYDIGDAVVYGRRPKVAAAALSFAVLAGWTAWRTR